MSFKQARLCNMVKMQTNKVNNKWVVFSLFGLILVTTIRGVGIFHRGSRLLH